MMAIFVISVAVVVAGIVVYNVMDMFKNGFAHNG